MMTPDLPGLLPLLSTGRLRLRPGTPADLPYLEHLFGDPLAMRFSLSGPLHACEIPAVYERLWGHERNPRTRMWCVEHATTGVWLGLAGGQADPQGPGCELSYRLLPQHWGHGYATEAVQACLTELVRQELTPVVAYVEADNEASLRVLLKCPLRRAGTTEYRGLPVQKFVAQ